MHLHSVHVLILVLVLFVLVARCQVLPIITTRQVIGGLNGPSSLFYESGYLFVLDTRQQILLKSNFQSPVLTIAGINNTAGFNGDGKLATDTTFSYPNGLYMDSLNIYIVDTWNQVLRKVKRDTMIVQTLAGNGLCGFSGDGQKVGSQNIQFCNPQGVFVVNSEIFIADTFNNRIRKIDLNGIISTVAGSSSVGGFSGDGGLAVNAQLFRPESVFVTVNGEIYIADTFNNRIRRVKNGIISTIAGSTTQGYNGDGIRSTDALLCKPSSVIVTQGGEILIADYCNSLIRRIFNNGTIESLAVDVRYPKSMLLDPDTKKLYISEYIEGNVKQVTFPCKEGYALNDFLICEPLCSQSCDNGGKCIAPDVCECADKYFGESCEEFTCFGVETNHSLVCSGHGSCVRPDTCECVVNYFNRNCSDTTCFGKNSTDPNVCNSHGMCSFFNTCQCEINKFQGNECEVPLCNGKNISDPFVCSGNGFCNTNVLPASCVCTTGMVGIDCEYPTCLSIPSFMPKVCGGQGECVGFNDCKCKNGYEGLFCETSTTGLVAGFSVTFVLAALLASLCLIASLVCCYRKGKEKLSKPVSKEMEYYPIDEETACNVSEPTLPEHFIQFDNITITKYIGNGNFGTVFSALMGEKEIALKKIANKNTDSEIDNIRKEIALMVEYKHNNIVRCIGYSKNDFAHMIIMERMDFSLECFIKNHMASTHFQTKLDIVKQFMMGIEFLHSQNAIHRDIKPANILLKNCKNTNKYEVKICDFGISTIVKQDPATTFVGTRLYMAPEVKEFKPYNQMVDIFASGLVMWELLFGKVFDEKVGILLSDKLIKEWITTEPQFENVEAQVVNNFITLIERCTSKNPDDRPTAAQVVQVIDSLMEQ